MVNPGNKMTGLEIGLLIGLVVAVFGGGVATGVAIKPDKSEEVVEAAMAPYLAEVENVKALIDPERTPFCDGESSKYDANLCAMTEMCATAAGSDVEVTADCKALSNILATEWLTTLMTDFADTNWDKFSKDKSEGWQKAADYFIRQWEKRKGG